MLFERHRKKAPAGGAHAKRFANHFSHIAFEPSTKISPPIALRLLEPGKMKRFPTGTNLPGMATFETVPRVLLNTSPDLWLEEQHTSLRERYTLRQSIRNVLRKRDSLGENTPRRKAWQRQMLLIGTSSHKEWSPPKHLPQTTNGAACATFSDVRGTRSVSFRFRYFYQSITTANRVQGRG